MKDDYVMTNIEIRVKVALLSGWRYEDGAWHSPDGGIYKLDGVVTFFDNLPVGHCEGVEIPPNFPLDLNAVHVIEYELQKFERLWLRYRSMLNIHSSAHDRCMAYIQVMR
jgi:hypothetical protein